MVKNARTGKYPLTVIRLWIMLMIVLCCSVLSLFTYLIKLFVKSFKINTKIQKSYNYVFNILYILFLKTQC